MFTNQQPAVGNADFAVEGTGFPPGLTAMLVLGLDPTFVGMAVPGLPQGCMQLTDDHVVRFGATGTGDVLANAASPGASGHVSFALPIPANGALAGLFVSSQVAVLDPAYGVPLPFATSNALHIVVF